MKIPHASSFKLTLRTLLSCEVTFKITHTTTRVLKKGTGNCDRDYSGMLVLQMYSQPLTISATKGFGTRVAVVQETFQDPGVLKAQRIRDEVEPPPKSRAPRLELREIFHVEKPPAESRGSCEVRPGCSALENLHRWSMHKLPGQPVLLLHLPQGEKGFPYIHSEPTSFQFLAVVSWLLTTYCCKQQSRPHCDLEGCCKLPPSRLCSWLSQPRSCSLSAQGNCSSPHCLGGPLVYGCFLCWRAPNRPASRGG